MFQHETMASEDKILFDTSEESDGTIRLLDLLPIVSTAHKEQRVYVIDEIDRSLHPNLSYSLIQDFLDRQNHNQIIVTTHDTHLLTFDLLRRDEIWFVEKDKNGATSVYSLEEFTPRYDRNIQKGYLKGRFGAIPMLGKKNFRS
jgi:AAA15 family ATPase/GTPase